MTLGKIFTPGGKNSKPESKEIHEVFLKLSAGNKKYI